VIGASNVVDPVATKPMRSVTWDRADNSVNGSNEHVEHGHMVGHEEGIELCPPGWSV